MKKIFSLFTALFLLATLSSCSDDKPTQESITTFSAEMLMGSNEVQQTIPLPWVQLHLNLTILQSIYNYSNTHVSSITAGHIHKGAAGTNGSVVFHSQLLHLN
jgi:hypothetical protein